MRTNWRMLVALALVPATLLSAVPQTVCICADGHREAICPTKFAQAQLSLETPLKAQRKCCQARTATHQRPATGFFVSGTPCCRQSLEAVPPVATPTKVAPATKSLGSFLTARDVARLATHRFPAARSENFSTPPPRDVVIVYLHLTI